MVARIRSRRTPLRNRPEFTYRIVLRIPGHGLRSWAENSQVLDLAERWGIPAISGGDRHGLEPNSNLNLSHGRTFAEFVAEVRQEGTSRVLFMPQYLEPLRLRWLQTVKDIFACHPTACGRVSRWMDRCFYQGEDGIRRPFSELWTDQTAGLLKPWFAFLRLTDLQPLRPALRFVLSDPVGVAL